MTLSPALARSLETLAESVEALGLDDDWIVFGGAAMALAGLEAWAVPDIDILAPEAAARRLIAAMKGAVLTPAADGHFRSVLLGRIEATSVPIEVMTGLEVCTAEGWRPVAFETRVQHRVGARAIPTPHVKEQIDMARRFGRSKDLQRAALLERLSN